MGESVTGTNERPDTILIEPVEENGGGRGDRTSSESTSSTSTNTDRGRGSGRSGGSGGRTNTETKPTEEVDGFYLLTDEEKKQYEVSDEKERKRLIKNAKRRDRYAKQKEAGGQTVKPRKVKQTKTETKQSIDVTQLNLIVMGLSGAVASRPNCEHWLLTEAEVNSITAPLSKMLSESQMFANMGQYSNQIALCMACVTVFMPRLIVTVQKQKEVKKIARTGQSTDTVVDDDKVGTTGKTKASNIKPSRGNVEKLTANGSNDAEHVPFYGLPIC